MGGRGPEAPDGLGALTCGNFIRAVGFTMLMMKRRMAHSPYDDAEAS